MTDKEQKIKINEFLKELKQLSKKHGIWIAANNESLMFDDNKYYLGFCWPKLCKKKPRKPYKYDFGGLNDILSGGGVNDI